MNFEKLKGRENYAKWKFSLESYLELEGYWEAVLGNETDAAKLKKAKAKITLTVDPDLYVHIQQCKSAKEIWETFQKMFDDSGLSRRIGLLRDLIICQ